MGADGILWNKLESCLTSCGVHSISVVAGVHGLIILVGRCWGGAGLGAMLRGVGQAGKIAACRQGLFIARSMQIFGLPRLVFALSLELHFISSDAQRKSRRELIIAQVDLSLIGFGVSGFLWNAHIEFAT